jgi:hypothetical protein
MSPFLILSQHKDNFPNLYPYSYPTTDHLDSFNQTRNGAESNMRRIPWQFGSLEVLA